MPALTPVQAYLTIRRLHPDLPRSSAGALVWLVVIVGLLICMVVR